MDPALLYEEDFYAWTQFQARELRRLRHGSNRALDLEHLAEEVRDLGKEQRNALRSWLAHIVEHLLLLEHSPAAEPQRGWRREVQGFRDEINRRLTVTLKRDLVRQLPKLHRESIRAVRLRAEDHAEPIPSLPDDCPYTLDQLLGDWWPGRPD